MELNLLADQTINGKIYPALAVWQARPYTPEWRKFGEHYPYTIPLRIQEYCDHHGVKINIYHINDQLPANLYYPIALGFFDFSIDYFSLMSPCIRKKLRQDQLQILFCYHEGDNPERIKQRLDQLAEDHLLPPNCYRFVSANTAAATLPGFVYFTDFELWYYQRNSNVPAAIIHKDKREREFTILNRLHKSWRAAAMSDLKHIGVLDNSYWSYCESGEFRDKECPIEIDSIAGLRSNVTEFLKAAPYFSDTLTNDERNNHGVTESKYYVDSYCNIVTETHFDADQSGGTFLTEKTFKPIKHGQMFFVAGPAGSLQLLRDLGYKVFDSVLDNSYDQEPNHTRRWIALTRSIYSVQKHLPQLFDRCRSDIEHNQRLFCAKKTDRLNTLLTKLYEHY
jgi:hypothetical protein